MVGSSLPDDLRRPADEALHPRELAECADRGVQRQAARIDPGIAEGVQRDALQVEVSLELVVAADRLGVGVADDERQPLREGDVLGIAAVLAASARVSVVSW